MMPGIIAERSTEQATALSAARREQGWDVPQLVMRLRQAAMDRGDQLPANNTMNHRVRLWEAGEQPPSARYQELLTAVYGKSAEELGLPVPRDARPQIDSERWGRVFARYRPWVLRRIYARVSDYALAEDLTSEAFIMVGRSLHSIDPADDDKLYGWLAVKVRFTLAAHFTKARERRELLARPVADDQPVTDPAAEDELSMPEEMGTHLADLRRMLAPLPPAQRDVLALRLLEDLSGPQIARRLNLSQSKVEKLSADGMAALRERMGVKVERPAVSAKVSELWPVAARKAVLTEAATGRYFTARELVEAYGLAEPETPQRWVHVLAKLKREGFIRHVGWRDQGTGRARVYVGITATATKATMRMAA